ncbi:MULTISPECIES: acetyl-CoA C-acyltransferase [Pontibacter]|uniref:acetyl-CoA C-acyltransferase n=1 Tax=Pontibacter lucknowensis TaxID=1077936 RepID=A0A1N6UJM5_9BACT|nr:MULTISPECIES: acetyl-CoA C-acyltransferase [Pontibacter]EJF11399.1 acetyl-CoA acetyltransferase [Pontibacter sp. BAB1700]SIQ65732.1 acetyl-CoA C-acetyltransferase [Pontibacter lucknowensis]
MSTAYIIDIVRTPVGKFTGALSSVRPDDMAAFILKELMARNPQVDPSLIEDVVLGAANQAGEDNRNVARMALLLAGLPHEIGGVTVNRLCASGLQSIIDAGRAITCGDGDVYLAGGVESMTRAPFVMAKAETAFARTPEIYDTTIGWRFVNNTLSSMHYPHTMGETAENVAERYGVSREAQDEFAHSSQLKYKAAAEAGKFKDEIIPIPVPQRKGDPIIFDTDEHPRLSSVEKLGTLGAAFKKGGTVTAGNASGINDGAAASIIVSEEIVKRFNLKPMARILSAAVAGVEPAYMGMGPVPATLKALKRAGLTINDIGLAEINEAFAAQAIPCVQELGINPDIVNVNGGSIAIGHPLGASGTRISATLLHEMKRRDNVRYGLATMCVGVGQGAAIIYEKL